MRQPVSHAKHNETHMSELLNRRQRAQKAQKAQHHPQHGLHPARALRDRVDGRLLLALFQIRNDKRRGHRPVYLPGRHPRVGLHQGGTLYRAPTGQGRGYAARARRPRIPDPAERRRGGTDGCQGFGNGARVGYSRIGSQRIGAGSQHSRNPGAVVAIGTGLPAL